MANHNLPAMFVDPEVSKHEVWLRLECNHYTAVSNRSSALDFPGDPLFCQVCDDERTMKPYLQKAIEIAMLEFKLDMEEE